MLTAAEQQAAARAQSLHQAARHAEAHRLIAPLAPRHPGHAELQMLAGMIASAVGQAGEALAAFRRAAAIRPDDPQVGNILANALAQDGDRAGAVALLERLVARHPSFVDAHINRALIAQEAGEAERALGFVEVSLRRFADHPRLRAIRGTLLKNLGRLDEALAEFDRAIAAAPGRALAHFHRGVTLRALERNDEADAAYARAEQLGLRSPALAAARAAALLELGQVDRAEALYEAALGSGASEAGPALARLRREYRDGADPFAHYAAAARAQPDNAEAWARWLGALLDYRDHEGLREAGREALRRHPAHPGLRALAAFGEAWSGDRAAALATLEELSASAPEEAGLHVSLAELLLRDGALERAEQHALAATRLAPRDQAGWAWLGTIWRLRGDPREEWLCDYERLVLVTEVESEPGAGDAAAYAARIAGVLEKLHVTRREPGNQSLRAGTQTSGALFARPDPTIRAFRGAVMRAVEAAVSTIPADPEHPFLGRRRDNLGFKGSWSVRLEGGAGHHVPHFHGEGWMSSAYYAALPASMSTPEADAAHAGHIQFGSPPAELGLDLAPRRIVRPEPGRLVLFPSYLWHGTLPFPGPGTRLTAAFDVLPEKG